MASKPIEGDQTDARIAEVLDALEKDPTPGQIKTATNEAEAVAAASAGVEAQSSDEPNPDEVESALAKLNSGEPEKVATEPGPQEAAATGTEEKGATDPALPVIEPPDSWTADAKANFSKLPRDLQAVIAERDAEQKRAFNRHVNEAAETKKAAEAERLKAANEAKAFAQERAATAQYLDALIQQAATLDPVLAQWNDPRFDKVKFAADQPAEFTKLQAEATVRIERLNQWTQARNQAAQQAIEATNKTRNDFLAEQNRLLIEKVPEWTSDPNKAKSGFEEVTKYAQEKYSVTPQEIHNLGDHRLVILLRNDMLKDRQIADLTAKLNALESKKAETLKAVEQKKVVQPTRVATPKAVSEEKGPTQRSRDLLNRARKTGNDRTRADLVLAALGDN